MTTSVDPSTGRSIVDVPSATAVDVADACSAARSASRAWGEMPPGARAERLRALAARLRDSAEELVRTEAIDAGMPVSVARSDLDRSIESLEANAGLSETLQGSTFANGPSSLIYSLRQPYGVVAVINPFNHPLMFAITKSAPALAAGNCVVVKPPSAAPLSTLLVAEATQDVLPPGVFNVVTGGGDVGSALVSDRRVGKVSFTGSGSTGAEIMRLAAANITPVLLELGGKNAMLVMPDVSVERAVAGAVAGMALKTCGQSCQSATRAFVHRSVHAEFVARLHEALTGIVVGDPLDPRTAMGPLVSEKQLATVQRYIKLGRAEGAQLVTGGGRPPVDPPFAEGYFVEPTVFAAVTPSMTIAREEIFGPVLSILPWDSLDAAIDVINDTPYGLTASIWTQRLDAHVIAARLEAGYVFVNRHGGAARQMPLAGWKQSGIGTSGGTWELAEFTRYKSVELGLS